MKYAYRIALVLLLSSNAHIVAAQNEAGLRLEQVISRVLDSNPQLRANELEAQAAFARVLQAQQSTPLTFNAELENFAGSGNFNGTNRLETTLSFARVLELGDKPELRGNVARRQAILLQSENDAKRLDLLAEATRRFVDILIVQHRLEIFENRIKLILKNKAIVSKRVRLGKSPQSESRRIHIELERAQIALDDVKHELLASRLRLSSLWGDLDPSFTTVDASLFDLQEPFAFAQLKELLQRNPDLAQFATRERLVAARASLARSRRATDIEISGGLRHHNASSDVALILSASIPFGAKARARPYEDEAELLSRITPHELNERRNALHSSLFSLHQELKRSYEALNILSNVIIPEAKQVLHDYQNAYAAGRYSLLELNDAQRTLLNVQLEAVEEASKYHRNKIEIERLTGKYMSRAEEK